MMMLMPHRSRCPFLNLVILLCVLLVGSVTPQEILTPQPPPQLNGLHLDITILVESFGFVNVQEDESDGGLTYSGFLVDVLKAIALPIRANFTYTFHSPSGFGSKCPQRPAAPYPKAYWHDFGCGEGDVIDSPLLNNYTTDMYVGAFYITPERQRVTQFTIPFYPPTTGTLAMVGTATGIRTFDDYVQQQEQGLQGPACVAANTQYAKFVRKTFPTMKLVEIIPGSPLYPPMVNGTCDVMIVGRPFAASFVFKMSRDGTCKAREDKVRECRVVVSTATSALEKIEGHFRFCVSSRLRLNTSFLTAILIVPR